MSLNLPKPPLAYDANNETQARRAIEGADKQNVKRDAVSDSIRMRDTVTGVVKIVTVASGALVVT